MNLSSIKQVNRLYLVTLLLVLVLGSIMQLGSFSWGLLGTEIFLILLPVLWFHRKNKMPLFESTRLRKPRASIALVALILGSGAWLIDSIIEGLMIQISGYSTPVPEGILPTNWFEAVIIFIAFAVAAPICEEFLFRGTIQRAYHNETKPFLAILIPSLMFVVYHLRFQGFLALIPIAFILGYTYWRTKSLVAVMLVHFANNAFAGIVLIQAGLFPEIVLPFPSLPGAAFGVLMVVAGLFLLHRLTAHPAPEAGIVEPPSRGIKTYWPLLAALVIFCVVAVLEITSSKLLGVMELDANQMPQQTTSYTYEVHHKGNQQVGEMQCTLQSLNLAVKLDCLRTVEAFEYQSGNSFYSSLDMQTSIDVVWDRADLSISQLTETNQSEQYDNQWEIQKSDQDLKFLLDENGKTSSLTFLTQTLVEDEWPWRLMGLNFEDTTNSQFAYLHPVAWRQKTQDSGPVLNEKAYLVVSAPEEVSTPAGSFTAWKVSLSNNQTAWYDVNAPHSLVKLEATMFDYYLSSLTE